MEVFQDYAYYYNSFYKDKNYKEEAETVHRIFERNRMPVKSLVNFGCGTGKHDLELSKLGYRCKGIDMSPLMIRIAKENLSEDAGDVEFEVADIRRFETQEKYDAVISLFHVMSYQKSNQDILSSFQSARSALKGVGGCFLFDVWYGPGVLSDKPCVRVKEAEDENYRLIRIAKPVMHDRENLVDVHYEVLVINKKTGVVQTIHEVHAMRYFFRPEIELLLSWAGFEVIDHMDCRTLGDTDYNSWTCYFVARAV